jgi:homoserine/homoserine lactone efflux protein
VEIFADLPKLASFVVAAILICILPGSTVTNILSVGLGQGFRAGLAAEAGAQIGRFIIVLLVALAVDAVTSVISAGFDFLKFIGAAYLLWLGIRFIFSPSRLRVGAGAKPEPLSRTMINGIFVSLTNPKAYLFFGAFLPQFADRHGPLALQIVLLGLIEMVVAAVTDTGYLLLAVTARAKLSGSGTDWLSRVAGVVLIAGGCWLAMQHQA